MKINEIIYVYHASYLPDLANGLRSVIMRGLVPSKDGYYGPGVYFAYRPEDCYYHVDKENATMFRAKWSDLKGLYGVYPANEDGIQSDGEQIVVPGAVPGNLLEVEYFEDEWWDLRDALGAETHHGRDLDEGWKNWVAGATVGAAALGGASHIYNKANNPDTTSQSKPTIQQVTPQKQFNLLGSNPQNELTMVKFAKAAGITGTELAQFLAQTKHESWDFTKLKEKEKGKNYFVKKYDIRFSPRIAKILGNTKAGDGQKYHGRGFIQLTGKYNYSLAGEALNLPLVEKPELAADPIIAAKIAVWYWNTRVKPHVTDFNDTAAVTRRINAGLKGLDDRHENFINYKSML
jgi:predicted chitinase